MKNTLIIDSCYLKAYERLQELGEYTGKEQDFLNELWSGCLADEALMKEFVYYLEHHSLLDEYRCNGYGLTDLFVWRISQYNLYHDVGKNTADCDKEAMILETFEAMVEMKKDPKTYNWRLTEGKGMDRFS